MGNLAVAKKLYAVVGVLAILIATELFTLLFAMDVLSAVRTIVAGEGRWSKAQKNAIYSLHRYASTGDAERFRAFERELEIPAGDRAALDALRADPNDTDAITAGFTRGGMAPADVPSAVRLLRRFYWVPSIARALGHWAEADRELLALKREAAALRAAVGATPRNRARIERALDDVDRANQRLTTLENAFSRALGEGSRRLESNLTLALLAAVLLVESAGLTLTVRFGRSLGRSLVEMTGAARRIGRGEFEARAPVRSGDEFGILARAINEMGASLRRSQDERRGAEMANSTKSQFLAHVSHEVRTPLNVILGLAEILRDAKLAFKDQLTYLDTITRTGTDLNRILNDILDLSRVEADHLTIDPRKFALTGFLSELRTALNVVARASRHRFELETRGALPAEITTDSTRLRQILVNLVTNAFKFTSGGQIKLACWLNGDELCFEVTHDGAGILASDETDLGWALASRLAHALGGDVKLQTTQTGHGTSFRATIRPEQIGSVLEVAPSRSAAPVAPDDLARLRGRRVLVVEDSEDNRLLVKLLLSRQGMLVDFAENGQIALENAPAGNYDFVLMDMQMPVKDGYAATRELRQMGYGQPILALTAHAMKEDRARCIEAGCDDYLTKPIDSRALYAALNRYLQTTEAPAG